MISAVIKTGGRQYLVAEGDTLKVEKLSLPPNENFSFDQVLLTATDKAVQIGQPLLAGAKVAAKVIRHGHYRKVTGVKMKAKKRYRRYFGHRQPFTEISITSVKTK